MKEKPLVSVVVTTLNNEKTLKECLSSVKAQTYPAGLIEIVVVDNFSQDRTKEIALEFTDLVFERGRGPRRTIQGNFGILEVASGYYILYLDADMILAPRTVEKCVERMITGECVALYIPEIFLGTRFVPRVRRFERSFYDGTVIDAARFFSKDIFCRVGGFHPWKIGVGDWDLDKEFRQRGKVELLCSYDYNWMESFVTSYSPAELVEGMKKEDFVYPVLFNDEAEISLYKYLAKKGWYVGHFDAYIEKWGKNDPDVRKQFGFFYRFFGVFFERGGWKRLLRHPIVTVEMYFLKFLVGLIFSADKLRPRPKD